MLSYYSLKLVNSSANTFSVGVQDLGKVNSTISYNYYVDRRGTLSEIAFVIFVHKTSGFPSDYQVYELNYLTYNDNLIAAHALSLNLGYLTGYNDKCLLGMNSTTYDGNL